MDFVHQPQSMHAYSLSSILFVADDDDDSSECCNWAPSSPKRCDRGQSFCMESMVPSRLRPPASSIRSGSNITQSRDDLVSCCTEELGSESTSGVGHEFSAPSIFYEDHIASMPAEAATRIWTFMHQPHAGTYISEEAGPSSMCSDPPLGCSQDGHGLCQYTPECRQHHRALSGNVRRAFPPPLSSLLCDRPYMRSFKTNGRFILKKIDNVCRSMFRSTRKDGRLRLDLLSDGLHDQDSHHFPASRACLPLVSAPCVDRCHSLTYIPPSSTLTSHKPTLSYDTSSPQALAMLIHSKGPCTSFVKEPKPPNSFSSSFSPIAKCSKNVKTTSTSSLSQERVPAHVVALLNLFPAGLGLIILEVGQSKYGSFVTLHGVYILKGLCFQSTGNGVALSRVPFFTNLWGIGAKLPEARKAISSLVLL